MRSVFPFLASLPFCVRPSRRLGEKKEKARAKEKGVGKRGEKNCGGGGRRASIFASEGTVAVARVHLPLRI